MNTNQFFKLTLVSALTLVISACGGGGGGGSVAPPPVDDSVINVGTNRVNIASGTLEASTTTATTVDAEGGAIAVTDMNDPLYGLEIEVPKGATSEPITFAVESATISDLQGIPPGASVTSRLITIRASGSEEWNTYGMFDKAVKVTIPYESASDTVGVYQVNVDGTLEPTGFAARDADNNTLTFWTRTFANLAENTAVAPASATDAVVFTDDKGVIFPLRRPTASLVNSATGAVSAASVASSAQFAIYVAIGLEEQVWADWANSAKAIDTRFRAATNGWYIPNYGSYYKASRGGNCFGMVGWAKYYHKVNASPSLYTNYRDAAPTATWVDDATAIELASRIHNGMSDIWNQYLDNELDIQTASSLAVARSLVGALYVTGNPALLGIYQEVNGSLSGGHAILTYRADIDTSGNITFHIYDPNFPGDDTRRINFINGTGFQNYLSGTSAESSRFTYNNISHVGFHVGLSDAVLAALKTSADAGFANDSVFPKITLTSITGKENNEDVMATTGTTASGQEKLITSNTAVIIRGTVLGGRAQTAGSVVNNLRVLTPQGNYSAAVDNQAGAGTGQFELTIPLLNGENMVAFVAAKSSSFSHWAAFDQIIIESTASVAAMTVTLAWSQGSSDIDLYVKEPDGAGTGDIVYYSHRRGVSSTNPYLDFDNTSGYGPEHYIAKQGMFTKYSNGSDAESIYGDYTVGVHYYADHDSNSEEIQPVSWGVNWRYLAYCAAPCLDPETEGFWTTGSQSGLLSSANSSEQGPAGFNGGGASWSGKWSISYPEPQASDYEVPESHEIMLP
jgi:uncharacterized protein YfaP (DUF2135 family)